MMAKPIRLGLVVAMILALGASPVLAARENTDAFKRAFASAKASGKSDEAAKAYASGYAEAKEFGLTDSRSVTYANAWSRAFLSGRDKGLSKYDSEAYATGFAKSVLKE